MYNKEDKFDKLIAYILLFAGAIANGIGFLVDILTYSDDFLSKVNCFATGISWLFLIFLWVVCYFSKKYYFYSFVTIVVTAFISFPLILMSSPDCVFAYYIVLMAPTFGLLSYKNYRICYIGMAPLFIYILLIIIKNKYNLNIYNDYLDNNLIHIIGGLSSSYIFCWLITFYSTQKNIKLNKSLEEKLIIDPLTKAKNRNVLSAEMLKNSGLIMIDIDHFKKLNDGYGHINGDKSLQFLVNTIKTVIKKDDEVIRYGGEEFIVIIRDISDESMLFKVAEAIRYSVLTRSRTDDSIKCGFTISLGSSLYDEELTLEDNIKIVDSYLYTAKHAGRNQTFTNFI